METRNKFLQSVSRKAKPIPFWVVIVLFFSHNSAIFAVAFTFVGGFIAYLMFDKDILAINHIDESSPKTECIISDVVSTNTIVNGQTVYEYHYEFTVPSGEKLTSFEKHFYGVAEIGDSLLVQYNSENPQESRILNIADDYSIFWDYFVFIFPLTGIILLVFPLISIIKKYNILKHGQIVEGTFKKKEATNIKINERRVYKLFFEFTANRKDYTISAKTHLTRNLEDDEHELIIYDVRNPEKAFPIDMLPKTVKRFLLKNG